MKVCDKLLKLAASASLKSYSPYSNLKVGAAIQSTSGKYYSGCNIENVSYPLGSCAEQSAISAMILQGDTQIKSILIYANSPSQITPCGGCRQRIAEFATSKTIIYIANNQGINKSFTLNDLLPSRFEEF